MHTYAYALPFKSWNMRRNIITTFFLVSSYPVNDWKLWLICFNETSIMNCSLINHNNPVLWALPFIQATAEVILHNYSKFPVFERGPWKRPIRSTSQSAKSIVVESLVVCWCSYFVVSFPTMEKQVGLVSPPCGPTNYHQKIKVQELSIQSREPFTQKVFCTPLRCICFSV